MLPAGAGLDPPVSRRVSVELRNPLPLGRSAMSRMPSVAVRTVNLDIADAHEMAGLFCGALRTG